MTKKKIKARQQEEIENDDEKSFGDSIVSFLSYFVAIPIFIVAHKLLPNPEWKLHLDRILLFLVTLVFVRGIFHALKFLVIIGFFITFLWLTYGSFWGNYGFAALYKDYRAMIHSMIDSPHPEEIILSRLIPFPNKSAIIKSIDYQNPAVRNFALTATTKHFQEYQDDEYKTLIQCFAIFKEINSKWNYVSDPKSREYFAKASESILHLSGDCDDHSILMAACIKAVGGTARLIHTTGHLYPELMIGTKKDLESINYLIKKKLFRIESSGDKIHYHVDEHDQVWLNLDYTKNYPGGPFMSEEILGILTLN